MDMNIDLISVQIQSLLNIPAIHKRYTGSNDAAIETTTEEPRLLAPSSIAHSQSVHTQEQRQLDGFGHVDPNRPPLGFPYSSSLMPIPPQRRPEMFNNMISGPPPPALVPQRSAPRPVHQQFSHMNSNGNQNQMSYRHQNEKAKTPPKFSYIGSPNGQSTQRSFEFNNPSRPRSKIISHMNELLRNEGCPRNFCALKEKLIKASLEEHVPMYHLNLDEEVRYLLGVHCIEPMATKSPKFVRAKYFCYICNYHMDNITNIISHVSNNRHESNAKIYQLDLDVKSIPFPSGNHVANLGFFISTVMKNHGIDEFERGLRNGVLQKLNKSLEPYDMELELFGSSVSGFGFKSSDINLNLDLTRFKNEVTGEPLTSIDHTTKVAQLSQILETFSFVSDVTEGEHRLEIKFRDTEADRTCSIQVNNVAAVLLSQLFRQYDRLDERVRYLVVAFRYWARQTAIDDQELGYLPGHAYAVMALKHLTDVGVIPYIILPDDTLTFRTFYTLDTSHIMYWRSESRETLGNLWLGLLRKYSVEFPFKEMVISLVQKNLLKSEHKTWNRRISIEDPIIPRSNLSRTASTNRVFDYIIHTFKLAFRYFGKPKLKGGSCLFDKVIPFRMVRDPSKIYFFGESGPENKVGLDRLKMIHRDQFPREPDTDRWIDDPEAIPKLRFIKLCDYNGKGANVHIISEDLPLLDIIFSSGDYYFEFDREICQGGEEPPKHCRACGKDDHVKLNCPEEIVPALSPVSYPDNLTLTILDNVMENFYHSKGLTTFCKQERHALVQDVYRCLVEHYPDVEILLFGSTSNGFGLRESDVDICIRFKENPVEKAKFHATETGVLLQSMVQILKSSGCMQEVFAIPTAKVPIIKFKHRRTRFEGDISLYNALALRNTELLRSYTKIDPRVHVLGCFVKQLTKICDIGDASKGSLSSYAYVLMLIHFLQQLPVPVLPILQEIPLENRPVSVYDGWDTYFCANLERLPEYWEHFGANTESVGRLLLGFFKYYTEIFNYEGHVITISQMASLSRKEARFTSSALICIEDPFEKTHNLGAGLTRRMSVFIIKTLQRYRQIFSRSIPNFSADVNYISYFLDPLKIRGEFNPPIDRQCRICNKIGHYANSCTFRNNGDSRQDEGENDGDSEHDVHNQMGGDESPIRSPREGDFGIELNDDISQGQSTDGRSSMTFGNPDNFNF